MFPPSPSSHGSVTVVIYMGSLEAREYNLRNQFKITRAYHIIPHCQLKESQPCDLIKYISYSGHLLISLKVSGITQIPTPNNETIQSK